MNKQNPDTPQHNIGHLCIIDDDPVSVFGFSKLLSLINKDIKPRIYPNAYTALEDFKSHNDQTEIPELIFLDINMPVMDAWQFMHEFNALQIPSRVVIISSSVDPADINKSRLYDNIIGYLEKPSSVNAIREVLQNQSLIL